MTHNPMEDWADEFLTYVTDYPLWAQAVNVVGEAGEFAEAFRRYMGYARRAEPLDGVMAELADVVISAFVMDAKMRAAGLGTSLQRAVADKMAVIMSRGFGEQTRRPGDRGPCHCDGSGHNRGHVHGT